MSGDDKYRFERALLQIAARCNEHGIAHRLVADHGRGGSRLALVAEVQGELLELVFQRRTAVSGTAWLYAEGRASAARLAEALDGLTREASRLVLVQRGCVVAAETMARELAEDFGALSAAYPTPALESLRALLTDATAMSGLTRAVKPALGAQPTRGHDFCYAAAVSTSTGRRAAPYNHARAEFSFFPEDDESSEEGDFHRVHTAADVGCELLDCDVLRAVDVDCFAPRSLDCTPDCTGVHFPDCSPDCVPDCGLDCGL